jgi:uncharacterized repeat protein (TIGR03803 family)
MKARNCLILLTVGLLSVVMPNRVGAQTFTVLHTFHSGDGPQVPSGQLTLDTEGNLYGVAGGGTGTCGAEQCGTVFRMNKSGTLTGVYSFPGADGQGPKGEAPIAGLLRDSAGSLFGVTLYGGSTLGQNGACSIGCGVVFKLDKTGKETFHKFIGIPQSGGYNPEALLIEDPAGNIYGTTLWGGIACGVVFKMNQSGQETVLYTFQCGADGWDPYVGVIRDSAGNLYGTTGYGSTLGCFQTHGCGVVYKVDPSGAETVLYDFEWGTTGAFPSSALIQDSAGNLYGETSKGGNEQVYGCDGYEGCGVVYELSPDGNYTVLYAFNETDGFEPGGGLVRDAAGNLYGTTYFGGTYRNCNGDDCGVVFKLDTAGNETVLHSFTGGSDGALPAWGLVMDASGNLYGTTQSGGDEQCQPTYGGCGVVFKITP